MKKRYNVYFAGQLLPGQDSAAVREKLASLFKADQATLDKLFSGKAQLIKRDCDQATAAKYKQAMEKAGAQPLIKAAAEKDTAAKPEPSAAKPMSAAERIAALAAAPDKQSYRSAPETDTANSGAAAAQDDAEDFGLAAAGADVLRPEERPQIVTAEIDTSGLTVDEAAQRLSQEPPPPPAAPDTSHLVMGEVGDSIPNLASDETPLSPHTDAIELAPAGTDFADCALPDPEPPELDLSAIDLAPPGTDVLDEQYRRHEQAKAPDTDHLSLEE